MLYWNYFTDDGYGVVLFCLQCIAVNIRVLMHRLSLVAQVAWWVKNCMIGDSTRIGKVSRFPLTQLWSNYQLPIDQTATLQLNWIAKLLEFGFGNGFVALALILNCWPVALYRIEFWSLPTHIQVVKLLTIKLGNDYDFNRIAGTADELWSWRITLSVCCDALSLYRQHTG